MFPLRGGSAQLGLVNVCVADPDRREVPARRGKQGRGIDERLLVIAAQR